MSKMSLSSQIEFETLEDVVVNNTNINNFIDRKSDNFRSLYKSTNGYYAIQVKRTKISKSSRNKLLFNWLLLESKNINISKYILYTEAEYGNKGKIFDSSYEDLYKEVVNSEKKSNALISRVKSVYENKAEKFKEAYEKIRDNYEFISEKNLDSKILDGFAGHFRRNAVSDFTFALRIKELIRDITGEIIFAVDNRKSYVCSYNQMLQKIEYICDCVKDGHYDPDYISFKKARRINLSNQSILQSREYLQLVRCKLPEKRIEEHLIYQQYYESIRDRLLEDNKLKLVENIETTTYDNFCSVKEELEIDENDLPLKRLSKTKAMQNFYAPKNQTRYGSCIYLTKDDVEDDIKISWEDD